MIYSHWSQVPEWNWPNFTPKEMACRHCGEYFHDRQFMDRLQAARIAADKPLRINSAHRCWRHNLAVGGAPRSMHKQIAADISLRGHNRHELLATCRGAGFTGFGFYQTFLHVDCGRSRHWFSSSTAKEAWSA